MANDLVVGAPGMKVSTCRDLVPLSVETLEFYTLNKEIKSLSNKIEEEQNSIRQLHVHQLQTFKELESKFPDLKAVLDRLDRELTSLVDPQALKNRQQYEEEAKLDPVQAEINARNRDAEAERLARDQFIKNNPHHSKLVQAYWRKISQTCHPDRTEDTQLHELFTVAKQFEREQDLEHLKVLWTNIQKYLKSRKDPNWFRENIKSRKKAMLQALDNVMRQKRSFQNTREWAFVHMYRKENPVRAVQLFESYMMDKITAYRHKISIERSKTRWG